LGASDSGGSVTETATGAKLGVRIGVGTPPNGVPPLVATGTGSSAATGFMVDARDTGAIVTGVLVVAMISMLSAVVGNLVGSFVGRSMGRELGGSTGFIVGTFGSRIVLTGFPKGSYVTLSTNPHGRLGSNRVQNTLVAILDIWHCGGHAASLALRNNCGGFIDSRKLGRNRGLLLSSVEDKIKACVRNVVTELLLS
jgi:hypothetical protein